MSQDSFQGSMYSVLKIGDKVVIDPSGLTGTIKYHGQTSFEKKGVWVGIHLDTPEGKHNGTVNGVQYFECPPKHGLFVRPENVHKAKASSATPRALVSPRNKPKPRSNSVTSYDEFDVTTLKLGGGNEDLFKAALDYENISFLRILVEEDGIAVTGTDPAGNTILHRIGEKGGEGKAVDVCIYLEKKGLMPYLHVRNVAGDTCSMMAAKHKNWTLMEHFISIGGDVISKPGETGDSVWDSCYKDINNGMEALHRGMKKQIELRKAGKCLVPYMRHKPELLTDALFKTAAAGDRKYVQMLVEEFGISVNSQDREGNTVLHWIAGDPKRLQILKYLVAMGGNIHLKNKVSDTPALVAARARAWSVLQYLVSIGASISCKDEKNGKSVFQYAQTLKGKIALQEGLQQRKQNGFSDISNQFDGDVREEEERLANKAQNMDQSDDGDGQYGYDEQYENKDETSELQQGQDDDFKDVNDVAEDIEQEAEVEQAKPAPQQPAPAPQQAPAPESPSNGKSHAYEQGLGAVGGTFVGSLHGKKKDKSKAKPCKLQVTDSAILISYKKGPFYSRKDLVDEYKWSDQMVVKKDGPSSVTIDLDSTTGVKLTISPCPADTLEDFVWKKIWRNVFELSIAESKQLLSDYDKLCNNTVTQLEARIKDRQRQIEKRRGLRMEKDKFANDSNFDAAAAKKKEVDAVTTIINKMSDEIHDLLYRFRSIHTQGETLLETFDRMDEALTRRLEGENQRLKDGTANDQFERAAQSKKDIEVINGHIAQAKDHQSQVRQLYAAMKQAELQYSQFVRRDEEESKK